MKLLGAILIICSSTLIGFAIARELNLRSKQLREMLTALKILETEVSYAVTPLPECFVKLGDKLSPATAQIFILAKDYLDQGLVAEEAWGKSILKSQSSLSLKEEDLQTLLDFSHNLGETSIEDQVRYISLAEHKLNSLYQEAVAEEKIKVKLWRYLGVTVGLFIAILII